MQSASRLSPREFIPLMAMMISLGALSIDAMLPALSMIANELGAERSNDGQFIVSAMFGGFSVGQIFYGPLSDGIGRKKTVYIGGSIFVCGSLVALFAPTFLVLIVGRVLQGLGVSCTRIVVTAIVRDLYEGAEMAKIMSLIMAMFILVPAIAPSLGLLVLKWGGWRSIFIWLMVQGLVAFLWLGLRQKETLAKEKTLGLRPAKIAVEMKSVFASRSSILFTTVQGLVFGNFVGFLMMAPQFFSDIYAIEDDFPLYFAGLALCLGCGSLLNSKLVTRWGMVPLCRLSLFFMLIAGAALIALNLVQDGRPTLWYLLPLLGFYFFPVGTLLGNLNALAMQPLGQVAGTGAAIVGSMSTFISLILGTILAQSYSGSLVPMALGYFLLTGVALFVLSKAVYSRELQAAL